MWTPIFKVLLYHILNTIFLICHSLHEFVVPDISNGVSNNVLVHELENILFILVLCKCVHPIGFIKQL